MRLIPFGVRCLTTDKGLCKGAGFTLLELMVVLVLAGLAVAIVAPRFSGTVDSATFKKHSRQLVAVLRELRVQSLSEGYETTLLVDENGESYRLVPDNKTVTLPPDMQVRLVDEGNTANAGIIRAEPGIAFFPDGSSSGGRLQLAGGGNALRVDVNWLTGEVSLQYVE